MVNIIMRLMGFGAAVDALDGETSKAYIGGVGEILSGAATLLGGLANIVAQIVPLHGASAYFDFARNISHDPSAALVVAGLALIHKGIADIGNRHATAKLANAVEAQAQSQASPAAPEVK